MRREIEGLRRLGCPRRVVSMVSFRLPFPLLRVGLEWKSWKSHII